MGPPSLFTKAVRVYEDDINHELVTVHTTFHVYVQISISVLDKAVFHRQSNRQILLIASPTYHYTGYQTLWQEALLWFIGVFSRLLRASRW